MARWLVAAALAVLAAPAPAAADALRRHTPIVVLDSGEQDPPVSVRAFAGQVPGVRRGRVRPTVYGRRTGRWLQYWMLFARNTQDRGVLRTGRHDGDWELIQVGLRQGRPVVAVYSQHATAERCAWRRVRRVGPRPLAFLARGSHAAYFVPGIRDRPWPDPNDHADGRGRRVRPRLVRVSAAAPAWVRWPGRWGAARAGWVPGEMDAPRGPAFQPQGRWSDPAGWAAAAMPCRARRCDELGECDNRETAIAAVLAGLGVAGAGLYGRRRLRTTVT
jgi:hypothetical protein